MAENQSLLMYGSNVPIVKLMLKDGEMKALGDK